MNDRTSAVMISIIIPIGPNLLDLSKLESTLLNNKNLLNSKFILVVDSTNKEYFESILGLAQKCRMPNFECINVDFDNPGETRNAGIGLSEGKWIQFWDSDDQGDLNSIMEFLEASEADLVVHQYRSVNLITKEINTSNTSNLLDLVSNPGIWRLSINRNFLHDVRFPPLSMAEDQVFLFKLLSLNPRIDYVKFLTYNYFIGSQTQLTSRRETKKDLSESMKLIASFKSKNKNIVLLQTFFLEKLFFTTIKHADLKTILKGLRILTNYLAKQLSINFFYLFLKSNVWLVRSLAR